MKDAAAEKALERRGFLGLAAAALVLGGIAAQCFYYLRAMVPNLLYERPRRAKVGRPGDFAEGYTYLEAQNVFLVKEGSSFYAMSAACTHLGCTVKSVRLSQPKAVVLGGKRIEVRQEFHCPCHGSRFYGGGENYAGPAPRPLERLRLTLSPDDGQLVVDLERKAGPEDRLTV